MQVARDAVTAGFQRCITRVTGGYAMPDLSNETLELLEALQVTHRELRGFHRTFLRVKSFDPLTVPTRPDECCTESVSRLARVNRPWIRNIVANIVHLGGYSNTVTCDGLFYILLSFCTLSKIELCQMMFYLIAKEMKSWTVQYLTSGQLQEFYEYYAECDVDAFNTANIQFDAMGLAKYSMYDFVELVHQHSNLINMTTFLQRSLQREFPSLEFWDNYDRTFEYDLRRTNLHPPRPQGHMHLNFFRIKKVTNLSDVVKLMNLEKAEAEGLPFRQDEEAAEAEAERTKLLQNAANMGIVEHEFGPGMLPLPHSVHGSIWHARALPPTPAPAWMQTYIKAPPNPKDSVFGIASGTHVQTAVAAAAAADGYELALSVPDSNKPENGWPAAAVIGNPSGVAGWPAAAVIGNPSGVTTGTSAWPSDKMGGQSGGQSAMLLDLRGVGHGSVENAKDLIRETIGPPKLKALDRERARQRDLRKKGLASAEDKRRVVARAQELEFIRKSREGVVKHQPICTMIERVSQCGLIGRPGS